MVYVTFTSDPPGATITFAPWYAGVYNHYMGQTPHVISTGSGVNWPVRIEKMGYEPVTLLNPNWADGAVNHVVLTPTYEPLQPQVTGGYDDPTPDPRVPGYHVKTPIDNRMPVYLDAEVWGSPAWYATRPESDPECPEWDNCVIYKYVPPEGYDIVSNQRGGIAIGQLPFCGGNTCSYTYSRALLKKSGTTCVENTETCAGTDYKDKYRCQSNAWTMVQHNAPECVVSEPTPFNIVVLSFVVEPNDLIVGQTAIAKIVVKNTGEEMSPQGMILQILVNGTVVSESPEVPPIPGGSTLTGSAPLTAQVPGIATVCGRIKEGFYNTPPQETCDTVTITDDSPAFNLVMQSVVVEPDAIQSGDPVTLIAKIKNVGTSTAPAGMVLQIKRNGVVVAESQQAPQIPAGSILTGEVEFTETASGTYTWCARIKEGYYNTPPQEMCDNLVVGAVSTGSANILSTPSGADAYLEGAYVGTTPKTIENMNPGVYNLTLKKQGYYDYITTFSIVAGTTTTVNAILEETEEPEPEPEPPSIDLWKIATVLSVAALGGVVLMSGDKKKKY